MFYKNINASNAFQKHEICDDLIRFIVSYLSFKFGDTFNKFMKTEAAKWFTIIGIFIIAVFFCIYFIIK